MNTEDKILLFITVTALAIAAYLSSQSQGATTCHFWQACFWQKLFGQIGGTSTTASGDGSGNQDSVHIGLTLDELNNGIPDDGSDEEDD